MTWRCTARSKRERLENVTKTDYVTSGIGLEDADLKIGDNFSAHIGDLENRMRDAAADLEFEEAARLRDEVQRLQAMDLGLHGNAVTRPSGRRKAMRG